MNFHHAAALALAGWYLLVPPCNVLGIPMTNWERSWVSDQSASVRAWPLGEAANVACSDPTSRRRYETHSNYNDLRLGLGFDLGHHPHRAEVLNGTALPTRSPAKRSFTFPAVNQYAQAPMHPSSMPTVMPKGFFPAGRGAYVGTFQGGRGSRLVARP
jgi:hypothetical protein